MRTVYQKNSGTHQGFTLVELAIVITIIGLLIGGVLKGQEMIQNARVTNTVAMTKSFQVAYLTFRDRFDNLPGDYAYATTKLPGCTAAAGCENGNGNGYIDNTSGDKGNGIGWGANVTYSNNFREPTQVWKHMAMADLISGVNPGANPAAPAWGQTHPASPFGGGFEIYYDRATTIRQTGLMLRLSNSGISAAAALGQTDRGPALSAKYAAVIDRKVDDGMPGNGYVFANYGRISDDCKLDMDGTYVGAVYNETDSRKTCVLFWQF